MTNQEAYNYINGIIISSNISGGYPTPIIPVYHPTLKVTKPMELQKIKQEPIIKSKFKNKTVFDYICKLKDMGKYDENHYLTKSMIANLSKKEIDPRDVSWWNEIINKLGGK